MDGVSNDEPTFRVIADFHRLAVRQNFHQTIILFLYLFYYLAIYLLIFKFIYLFIYLFIILQHRSQRVSYTKAAHVDITGYEVIKQLFKLPIQNQNIFSSNSFF